MITKGLHPTDAPRPTPAGRRLVEQLLSQEISFVANPEFMSAQARRRCEADGRVLDARLREAETGSSAEELPAHLSRLCLTRLLPVEDERALFRRMNYLKFRANAIRSRLNPRHAESAKVREIMACLNESRAVRDHLVHSNTRLVISIVRKHVTSRFSFDELLSEGLTGLIQATEKFDYDRGFRFSTYAFQVVTRSLYRFMQNQTRDCSRFLAGSDDSPLQELEGGDAGDLRVAEADRLRLRLDELVNSLDRRERFIVRCRFGLGGHRKSHTLQHLADKLGVSKERVRQIERRALGKLQSLAAGLLDDNVLLEDLLP